MRIHTPPDQLLRVFASSTNGAINVKIPSSFEGALIMSTTWGSVNLSEAIKAKLTTFSSSSNKSRSFVGDWQAQGFGAAADPNDDPPLPGPQDPFAGWTGPLVDISSTNGSISLSYIEEDTTSAHTNNFTRAIQGFMDGWFGRGGQAHGPPPMPPPPTFNPPPPPMFHRPLPPMFRPPPPGAWPAHPKSSVSSAGLSADGPAVGVNDLPSKLEELNKLVAEIASHGGQALAVPADVPKEPEATEMVRAVSDAFSGLDVMVANAGIRVPGTPLLEMPEEDFDKVMSVNCKGTLYCYRAAAKQTVKQTAERGGRIIGASSTFSLQVLSPCWADPILYFQVCHRAITQTAALEWGQYGITVSALAPGPINTPLVLKRMGEPEEVAAVVSFFASPGASYITGQTLSVDGGQIMS
ncbi:hypothetical protein FRC11_009180 [Ceratobasidium sp. 423]|nr:hypothetical protein FRC11_009180 [Ceratobasidium sp. 423]